MRITRKALALASVAVGIGGLQAGPAVAKKAGTVVVVTTTAVNWTLTSAACPALPAGTVINGVGTLVDKVTTETRADGSVSLTFDDLATGTATDQTGATSTWRYDNLLREENTAAHPNVYTGRMHDSFHLQGAPVILNNGFMANITDDRDAGTFVLDPVSAHGDPFDFPNGPNRCDPM